jgi:hypothetical protein
MLDWALTVRAVYFTCKYSRLNRMFNPLSGNVLYFIILLFCVQYKTILLIKVYAATQWVKVIL